jgi:hypothetical protein
MIPASKTKQSSRPDALIMGVLLYLEKIEEKIH